MVECYFWILGVYFEPQYCLAKKFLSKIIMLTSVLDDMYDLYSTLEELILFTDAIERWDMGAMDRLPEYMRGLYWALLDVYSEMEEELATRGVSSYRIQYAKAAGSTKAKKQVLNCESDKTQSSFFKILFWVLIIHKFALEEAKWFHEGNVPAIEEYMKVALVSSGHIMLAITSFVGMGENFATKEAFKWVSNDPLIVRASAVISRLIDDMVGHETEQERGGVASAVECHMKQYEGISEEEVFAIFEEQIANAWKEINQECIRPTAVPMPFLLRILKLAGVVNLLYKDKDGYTNSKSRTKDLIASLLVDSVS